MNQNFISYVGYEDNEIIKKYFSQETVNFISTTVTTILKQKLQKSIVVTDSNIINVMNDVYRGFRPPTSDIYSRYTILSNENLNMISSMINQVVSIITNQIVNDFEITKNNLNLSKWVIKYGDENPWKIRSHDIIKIRNNKPPAMLFHMKY
jgi:hypothetical protein